MDTNKRIDVQLDSSMALQTTLNPQDPALKQKMIGEAELKYLNGLLKGNSVKWEMPEFLSDIHEKASFTAKILTQEMIEGKAPILDIIELYKKKDKKSIRTLLFRIEKLFNARAEVIKIFTLIFRIFHDLPEVKASRGTEVNQQLMKRLKILLRQFTIENHIYDKKFIYKGENILKLVNSELS